MIPVTKTFFPPIKEYQDQLARIWENKWLTNRGELVIELEDRLKAYLDVPNITLTTNGTLPIQIALKVLAQKGEVITTPFSYVATTSAVVWENCRPVFVDINPEYLTIDETKIENAITKRTTAILATHVFGNPCEINKIQKIAEKYDLAVIYDAAHCFGVVKIKVAPYLIMEMLVRVVFMLQKLFHTGEGGAIFSNNKLLNDKFISHNFGHNGPENFHGVGVNAKMSELQAAMGLTVFNHLETIFLDREEIVKVYNRTLDFSNLRKMKLREETKWNYSYYPVVFNSEAKLLEVVKRLNQRNIFPRRYFYPSLNTLNYVEYREMQNSEKISKTILCLPLYLGLKINKVEMISQIINEVLN